MGQSHSNPRGSRLLRKGRSSQYNLVYHVISRTRDDKPVFDNLAAGRMVVHALHMQPDFVYTLAFAVMPDHLHWLMQIVGARNLSRCVNAMKSASARRIGQLDGSGGGVWSKGFYDRAIRQDDDLETVARYVVANPLRAGLVKSLGDYPLWDAVWV